MSQNRKNNSFLGKLFGEPAYLRKLKTNKFFKVVTGIWNPIYTGVKITLGAVATVLLIVVVCGFVFAGILGDYLEDDILPNASVILDDYEMDSPSIYTKIMSKSNCSS